MKQKGNGKSRGDSRPRRSGGAKLRWVRLGKIYPASLDRTAEAAVPTCFLAYESVPVLPSPRFFNMPMPSSSIEEF
jgi:hypothetical protein